MFCPTKNSCEKYCADFYLLLGELIRKYSSNPAKEAENDETIESMKENFSTPNLFEFVSKGRIAFHHSGINFTERYSIEDLFKNYRLIKVIFCTSTLAAGVNLPAKRVIIASLKQGNQSLLSSISYKQMVGRAGRFGFDTEADSYICIPKSRVFSDKKAALNLMNKNKIESIKSCFDIEKKGLSRIILDSIGTELVEN